MRDSGQPDKDGKKYGERETDVGVWTSGALWCCSRSERAPGYLSGREAARENRTKCFVTLGTKVTAPIILVPLDPVSADRRLLTATLVPKSTTVCSPSPLILYSAVTLVPKVTACTRVALALAFTTLFTSNSLVYLHCSSALRT